MKITSQQLPTHLQKHLLPFYWVSGDDPLLLQEACDAIRNKAKNEGFLERNIFDASTNSDWQQLKLKLNSLSLFADKSLLEIRLGSKALPDPGKKLFQDYLVSPAPEKIILFMSDKLEASTLKTKWFQSFDNAGAIVQVWPLSLNELPSWIKARLQRNQLQTDAAGIRLLAERGEGNLLALAQDIEKLALLYSNQHIQADDIAAAISDNARFDVFALADAAVAGDGVRVLRIINGLKQEGTEPILVLWAIAREVRMLAAVSRAIAAKENKDLALKNNGVWPRRMPLVSKALQRQGNEYWQSLLKNAYEIDLIIKGVVVGNVWDELESLALNVAGEGVFNAL